MAIVFSKIETEARTNIVKDGDSILTPLYGKIKVAKAVDDNFTYFDTVNGYDLFVNDNGDETFAVKVESLEEITEEVNVESDIEYINSNYEVDNAKWADSDNAIIIKGTKDTLQEIADYYSEKGTYLVSLITPEILFLEMPEELEEAGANPQSDMEINKFLDDSFKKNPNAAKQIIQKAGIPPNVTNNKPEDTAELAKAVIKANKSV